LNIKARMVAGHSSLHPLQRFSEREVSEESRGEETSSLAWRGFILTVAASIEVQNVLF
jgi:hypothetical protein